MSSNKKVVEQIILIVEQSGLNHIEAVLEWCEQNNIDPEFAGNVLKKNKTFKKKLKKEALELNLLKG